jgi:hypothetical protein
MHGDGLAALGSLAGNAAVASLIKTTKIQRDPPTAVAEAPAKPKIDYKKAAKANSAKAKSVGWEGRLAEVRPAWAALWSGGNTDAFADAVAAFQVEAGLKGKAVDGILGKGTWNRLRPIGEVIAEQAVSWEKSKSVCSIATQERLTKGFAKATGTSLVGKDEKDKFRIILHSIASKLMTVPEEFRGTGAAGALAFIGEGDLVDATSIWDDKALKPGAAIQVWDLATDMDRMAEGKEPESGGTSFVFLKYVGDDAMKVLHFDEVELKKRGWYEVWFGANLRSR